MISLHQEKQHKKVLAKPRTRQDRVPEPKKKRKPVRSRRRENEDKKGQGEEETRWKGCLVTKREKNWKAN